MKMTLMITKTKIAHERQETKDDLQYCQYCKKVAICNAYTCYKKKQGEDDCSSCKERLCKQHWRVYFRRNVR